MSNANLGLAAAAALAAVVVTGAVIAMQTPNPTPEAAQSGSGDTTLVKAPYTEIEKSDDGVRVKAPGVDVQAPKSPD